MDPKTIAAAKAVPNQLRKVMDGLFEESRGALQQGVSALRESLGMVERYLVQVEKDYLAARGGGRDVTGGKLRPARGRGRRRRRPGRRARRFGTAEFVLAKLAAEGKGLRPRDIAEALRSEVPGVHKDALAVVNTTLARLKARGMASSSGGMWTVAGATRSKSK